MTEPEINQLNQYLYGELESVNQLIKLIKQINGDTVDLIEKRNKLQKNITASLDRLEAIWEKEKESLELCQ